ncbi:MAG: CHAT domain-containing tetratricopeptide repeat protein [Candidatus Eisenbacteria bacterium]
MRLGPQSDTALAGWLLFGVFLMTSLAVFGADKEYSQQIDHIQDLIDGYRYNHADSLATEMLASVEETYGAQSMEVVEVLDLIVKARSSSGGKIESHVLIKFAERALEIRESLFGPDDPEVATGLLNLGLMLNIAEDYESAVEVYDRGIAIAERAHGADGPLAAKILAAKGRTLQGPGTYSEAVTCLEQALSVQEATIGEDHIDTAKTLEWLCWAWHFMGEYQNAIAIGDRGLKVHDRLSPPNRHLRARLLNAMGCTLSRAGNHERAWDMFQEAYEISTEILGPDVSDVGYLLYNMGELKLNSGELDDAYTYYEKGLEIIERTYGPEYGDVAYALFNLAQIQNMRGDYVGARSLAERVITIDERVFGADSPRLAVPRQLLAVILENMGEHAEARSILEHSLSVLEGMGEQAGISAASCRGSLASLLSRLGSHEEARSAMEQALSEYEDSFGPEHAATGHMHNRLGWVYYTMDEVDLARQAFERALAIHEKTLGPENAATAGDLGSLGVALTRQGRYDEAGPLFERAQAILEKAEDPPGPRTAMCLHNLAILRRDAGNPEAAALIYDRAIPLIESLYGMNHPNLARTLYHYAVLLAGTGKQAEALEIALRAEEIGSEHHRLTSRRFAEQEGLRYAAVRVSGLDLALTIATEANDPNAIEPVWDALIRSRALVLDEVAARHRTVTDISRLAQDLVTASERLARLMVRGPGGDSPERYNNMVEEARSQKDRSERALADRSGGFREDQRRSKATLRDVASGLPRRSALISFIRYDRHETDPSMAHTPGPRPVVTPSYAVLIQRTDERLPHAIALGDAEEIDWLVSEWRKEFEPGEVRVEAASRIAGANLRRRIWDPVAEYLEGIDGAVIVPDGALNLVSFAALPEDDGGYVVETGPIVRYASAERDLVPSAASPMHGEGMLALGGPDFGAEIEVAALNPATSFRGQRSGCSEFSDLRFAALAGATAEADEIASLWRDTFDGKDVVHLTGPAAGEAVVKLEAPGKRVLHLATHGFFLGNCASALETRSYYGGLAPAVDQPPPIEGENPLILAGLALAGANRRASAGPDEEDGILTAQEIGAMDLSSVEAAVLSACDTGVGEVRTGEGVFGLRRAFRVAGVRTLVMSLWSVDDEATRDWMQAFYEKWLVDGLSKPEAVHEASLAMLHARRDRGENTHPVYWGAFVAAGDWE